ncbi:major facilitator superfamily domain-containing protein [Colletotrichum godetiae]|uniref:Major facilitator superfamily domain-containing protein n=1 Tax=Colletotrichum godetiae TaxID=1209918 RepID=A0AAJ0AVZ4_9PEZI|nr:major facilitator superfamily domain-containing protein [Colletotrichum godetiae]KAK1691364.1 major facilitator superfamily domain-containing protein [Colletotrichum godetiae]
MLDDPENMLSCGLDEHNAVTPRTNANFHPRDWPNWRKILVIITGLLMVMHSTISSSLPGNAGNSIRLAFPETTDLRLVLPVSIYLVGFVLGPAFLGPMSEVKGRRPVLLATFVLYIIFTLACALAPSFPALLVFRLLYGTNAAAPVAIVGGVYADMYSTPRERGWCIALLMAVTNLGPCLGPIITGCVSPISWRWSYWVSLILAGSTLPLVLWLPETSVPVLQEKGILDANHGCPETDLGSSGSEIKKGTGRHLSLATFTKSFPMLFSESILIIFYLYLQAYPVIFQGSDSIYKLSTRTTGLAFLPIGVGALLSGVFYVLWDIYLERSLKFGKPWTKKEEMRRLPLACAGGPIFVVASILFGIGFVRIFIAMLNYITDAYAIYAASAHGVASTCRSIFGALLPLAGRRMYKTLGVGWASTLLGICGLFLAAVPFVFIKYGPSIRSRSKFAREIQEAKHRG